MIIENHTPDIQTIGDIQEFKTTIDPRNLELITMLLSSNLYSNPEDSFIREIISNAWDSHVEAGTTAEPIVVRVDVKNTEKADITIRDYGTGLSPERFRTIFCSIGSSTKRDSNDYTGGFGIGRFSCLACSDNVLITSYYEGMEYRYLMSKSGNTVTTHLLNSSETSEKNGVGVTLTDIQNIHDYLNAFSQLVFFRNVYVSLNVSEEISYKWHYTNPVELFNTSKTKLYNNFAVTNYDGRSSSYGVLLGKVLYKLEQDKFSTTYKHKLEVLAQEGVFPRFEVGDLEITPNRESLIYTKRTIKAVEDKLDAMWEEVKSLIMPENTDTIDCHDTLELYCKSKAIDYTLDLLEDGGVRKGNNRRGTEGCLTFSYDTFFKLLLQGKPVDNVAMKEVMALWGWNCNGMCLGRLQNHLWRNTLSYEHSGKLYANTIIELSKGQSLSPLIKDFIEDAYEHANPSIVVLSHMEDSDFLDIMRMDSYPKYNRNIEEILLKDYRNYATVVSKDSQEYQQYKARRREGIQKKESKKPSRDIILTTYGITDSRMGFKSLELLTEYLKKLHECVILCPCSSVDNALVYMAGGLGYKVLGVAKASYGKLPLDMLPNVHTREWFYNCRKLRRFKAVCASLDEDIYDDYRRLIDTLPQPMMDRVVPAYKLYKHLAGTSAWYFCKQDDSIKEDPEWAEDCALLNSYMEKFKEAYQFSNYQDLTSCTGRALLYAYIIKSKAYRVNMDTYRQYKSHYLTKILCGK